MGIKGLYKVISDNAPSSIRVVDWKTISGRKIAIDASMSLYQFLIAVRQLDGTQLTGEDGKETSHLIGMFYRTVRLIENGVKPVYVFDGKPPDLKGEELDKRLEARNKAETQIEDAVGADAMKFERRTVHATKEHNEEAQKLLQLMGVPIILAPCEAESTCARLARSGKVWGAGSEDMDTLTFNSPFLVRKLSAGDQKKNPITEINLDKCLDEMDLKLPEFIDLCILLGCDYCEPIKGMGPQTALKLIREFKSIEKIKEHLDQQKGKLKIPDDYPFEKVRDLFVNPDVIDVDSVQLKWTQPDVDGLIDFLVKDKGFAEDRVRSNCAKLSKALDQKPQGRLTDFFKVKPVVTPAKRGNPSKGKTPPKKKK